MRNDINIGEPEFEKGIVSSCIFSFIKHIKNLSRFIDGALRRQLRELLLGEFPA